MNKSDRAMLEQLLSGGAPGLAGDPAPQLEQPAPAPASAPAAPAAASNPQRKRSAPSTPGALGLYDKLSRSIALLFALAVGAALWRADGFFTLLALEGMGVKLAGAGGWRWLIPVAITATTIGLWPRAGAPRSQVLFFLAVNGFNIGTSFAGLLVWGAGRNLPLFTGITIPRAGWELWAVAGLAALVLAYGPERLARWAAPDLWALWK